MIDSYAKRFPKAVQCLEDGLEDSLAFYAFPMLDARKISSSNMIERLKREIRRRTSAVGIFPNESSYVRVVTTYLMEYAEDWSVSRVNIQRSGFCHIIAHQRRSSVESLTVFFALIGYLCETWINERIVIKRKTSDSIYGNDVIENW